MQQVARFRCLSSRQHRPDLVIVAFISSGVVYHAILQLYVQPNVEQCYIYTFQLQTYSFKDGRRLDLAHLFAQPVSHPPPTRYRASSNRFSSCGEYFAPTFSTLSWIRDVPCDCTSNFGRGSFFRPNIFDHILRFGSAQDGLIISASSASSACEFMSRRRGDDSRPERATRWIRFMTLMPTTHIAAHSSAVLPVVMKNA